MLELLSSIRSIGLELTASCIRGAEVSQKKGAPSLTRLFSFPLDSSSNVKQLYMEHPILATGLAGSEVLIRFLHLPLKKDKDIDAALAFQAEPLLPYPPDEAVFARQLLRQEPEGSDLTLLAARKDHVQTHLEHWQSVGIEPEKIGCIQSALCQFGKTYIHAESAYLMLHIDRSSLTCVLIEQGKLIASFSQIEKELFSADLEAQLSTASSLALTDFSQDTLIRLQRGVTRMGYALSKESKGEALAGLVVTGDMVKVQGLAEQLAQTVHLPLLTCIEASDGFSTQDKHVYAISIGLALNALPAADAIDFRQQELSYPHPWKRLKVPLALYFILMLILSGTFYFFGNFYLSYKENFLKQEYASLLAGMNKSYDQFEEAFLAKAPAAREKNQGEVVSLTHLTKEDLLERLAFLQKDLHATPDSFPLFANIPRVSDVLAWLSQHPTVTYVDEEGNSAARLQIENFSYIILKRPMQGKKQEKYQVKVELEFSSPTPKWAREFHDALIAPNDWIDPKGEVKWSSNRGRYKTSFYLKDKTTYPSQ
ncbi:type IV pilus biogenesis protein PilM [Candidatus Protochlamydia phocaeensis]|uniref:type IV pilus biogenesis protein PilM n=1 Tax=Candidatus Protochlamydia phocaeensis TaxID=1414722 RepID=UPI0008397553|nr:hypothetical protein [Candidatus Protochlamydia phocaeensis]